MPLIFSEIMVLQKQGIYSDCHGAIPLPHTQILLPCADQQLEMFFNKYLLTEEMLTPNARVITQSMANSFLFFFENLIQVGQVEYTHFFPPKGLNFLRLQQKISAESEKHTTATLCEKKENRDRCTAVVSSKGLVCTNLPLHLNDCKFGKASIFPGR